MYWIWTPFLDRELISNNWHIKPDDKRCNSFIQDLALLLAPELEGLEYDVSTKQEHLKPSMHTRVFQKLKKMGSGPASASAQNRTTIQFWENILLNTKNPVWTEHIDKKKARTLIYKQPSSEILWNAATIQLLYETC